MNMRPYDPTQPLIYLHVPKCAGRSMVFLLARWFGASYHQPGLDGSNAVVSKIETRDADGNWLTNVRCIHASFDHGRGYGLPYLYPEIKQYVTILRDPFDAAVSMYFSSKRQSRQKEKRGQTCFRGKPIDFCKRFANFAEFLRQYPTWYFDHLPIGLDLSNYRQFLADRFVYIGVLEDLAGSTAGLARKLDKPKFEIPHLNSTEIDEPVPEKLRVQFYQDYPLLKRIHEFAREHYQRP